VVRRRIAPAEHSEQFSANNGRRTNIGEPSARRGSVTAPAMATGFRGVITFTTRYRMVHHGWLTPIAPSAALHGRTRIVANVRRRFARAIRFTTTAGLRQPLLVYDVGPLKNNDIRGAQTHVHKSGDRQPAVVFRTASATATRRLSAFHAHLRTESTGGLRPPLLCCRANVRRRNSDFCDAQTHISRSGDRQPAVVR
jgi:hypothetical protein